MKQQQRKTWEGDACIRFPTLIGAECLQSEEQGQDEQRQPYEYTQPCEALSRLEEHDSRCDKLASNDKRPGTLE